MSKITLRVLAIVLVVGGIVGYSWWHTSTTWQYEQIEPGILYRCSMRDAQEAINATQKADARSMVLLMTAEQSSSPAGELVQKFGMRNRIAVNSFAPANDTLSTETIRSVLEVIMTPKRQPVILISPDGRLSGMMAAAYQLSVKKMPLDEVLRRAELRDAPEATTLDIREFAERYAAAMK